MSAVMLPAVLDLIQSIYEKGGNSEDGEIFTKRLDTESYNNES